MDFTKDIWNIIYRYEHKSSLDIVLKTLQDHPIVIKLTSPLQFWFNKRPQIAIPYCTIPINFEFKTLDELLLK